MERIDLVGIYLEYIKKEGTFEFGLDELDRLGVRSVLAYFRLDYMALTEIELQEIEKELRIMAEEHDYFEDFEKY